MSPPVTRLPLRRLVRRANLDPGEGICGWTLEERTAKQLDEVARSAGTTPFIIRLAAFAALLADVTGNATVALWSLFDNRNRADAQSIAGPFVNIVPLVFSFDANKTFMEWLNIVHRRLFDILAHSELPFDTIKKQLQTMGINPPETDITFMLSSENSDQHFGNLLVRNESFAVGTMPRGCTIYVDEKKPENCQVRFDANLYCGKDVKVLLDRYLRLLDIAGREPNLRIARLLKMMGVKPRRWTRRKYTEPIYDFLLTYYASSPLLKMCWRPIRRWVLSEG